MQYSLHTLTLSRGHTKAQTQGLAPPCYSGSLLMKLKCMQVSTGCNGACYGM